MYGRRRPPPEKVAKKVENGDPSKVPVDSRPDSPPDAGPAKAEQTAKP